MDGIFGWLGESGAHREILAAMGRGEQCSVDGIFDRHSSQMLGVAACSRFGKSSIHVENGLAAALHGRPLFLDDELTFIARDQTPAAAAAYGWVRFGKKLPTLMRGTFAVAVLQPLDGRAFLAVDRIGAERLCHARGNGHLVFGSSAQAVAAHPAIGQEIDPQAIYEYLYFHQIPSPRTLYRGIAKLEPAQYLVLEKDRMRTGFYWQADYTPPPAPDFEALRGEFRATLDAAVGAADGPETAAFLSGGTDSSTVVGTMTQLRGAPVDSFSIGFDAAGFDEMEYARCAAERYRSRAHEYYLKPQDILTAIPVIAREYDEPFGNASAVPTYFCAKNAHEAGFAAMLSGDGGDEIFGGNARYAKQKVFELYFRVPQALRRGVIEPVAHLPGLSDHLPLRKLKRYVDQANVRLPLRLETYNFLHATPLAEIFDADFIASVDVSSTDRALTAAYERTLSDHYVNRLMHLDLKFTLADNDLRKVGTMTEAAGIEVRYPLLDDRMVEFANRLPVDYKVRGTRLRWFFKEALRDVLPEKIINKSKHGFGLPFGVWSIEHAPLTELVGDSLADLGRRGWVRPAYLDHMLKMQREQHASYYGVMIWVMVILEQWLAANAAPRT
jgi:asparagine synthase (glutamine-hydrolysing)